MEQVVRFELTTLAWKARMLPTTPYLHIWLERLDSNQHMPESKSGAFNHLATLQCTLVYS